MKYQLIASPYPEGHLVVSPGREGGIKIGASRYAQLRDAAPAAPVLEQQVVIDQDRHPVRHRRLVLNTPGLPAPAIEKDQLHEPGTYEDLSDKCK
jgi:hypothetical protein